MDTILKRAVYAALGSLLLCCSGPTEVVVTVDSLFGVPCAINTIRVEVESSDGARVIETIDVVDADLPGSLVLSTDSGQGQVEVQVTGLFDEFVVASALEPGVDVNGGEATEVRFLLDSTCRADAPCGAVRVDSFSSLPKRSARAVCGEEKYQFQTSAIPVVNACDSPLDPSFQQVLLGNQNEEEAELTPELALPFDFTFYGLTVRNVWVGDNGYLAFTSARPSALTADIGDPRPLGELPGFPPAAVLPFWDRLQTGTGGICSVVQGEAPNRRAWFTWSDACFEGLPCGPGEQGALTFSAGLSEDGRIIIGYEEMTADGIRAERAVGQTAVVGVTGPESPRCPSGECTDGECDDGRACGYTEFSARTIFLNDNLPTIEFSQVE